MQKVHYISLGDLNQKTTVCGRTKTTDLFITALPKNTTCKTCLRKIQKSIDWAKEVLESDKSDLDVVFGYAQMAKSIIFGDNVAVQIDIPNISSAPIKLSNGDEVKINETYIKSQMLRRYELIQEYPGSPKKGTIVKMFFDCEYILHHYKTEDDIRFTGNEIENFPKIWKLIQD